jgi:hypothetical protein
MVTPGASMALRSRQEKRNGVFADAAVDVLISSIEEARQRHERDEKVDSIIHNFGTGLALASTTTATILPSELSIWTRAIAGFATFLIAFLGRLDFGARWRWQLEMKAEYQKILDYIRPAASLPPEERAPHVKAAIQMLVTVRSKEKTIPGSGAHVADVPQRGDST